MSVLVRTDDVRRQNTRLIMNVLRRARQASRTEIVEKTGLSPATVSTITSGLLAEGILLSIDETASGEEAVPESAIRRGRPRISLALNPAVGCVVVMAVAMNSLSARLQDYSGQVLAQTRQSFPSHTASPAEFGEYLKDALAGLLTQRPEPVSSMPLRYIALGVQGVVDSSGQTMLWSPITVNRDLPLAAMLKQAFDVPVWIANDCNMIAEALYWRYPEQFGKDFAAVLLAQGIGMGLMLKGKRFIGVKSSAAEFGHVAYMPQGRLCRCGQRGCVEAYAGDYAIWRRVAGLADDSEPLEQVDAQAMAALIARAHAGEGIERQAYREAGQAIGHGLRSLFALLDPVAIAFVGQGAQAFDLMEPEIRKSLIQNGKMLDGADVEFSCYEDSEALIHLGCAITALQALDHA